MNIDDSKLEADIRPERISSGNLRIPMLCVVVGPRGSGKTYSAVQLMRHLIKSKAIDAVHIISPTFSSNSGKLKELSGYIRTIHSDLDTANEVVQSLRRHGEENMSLYREAQADTHYIQHYKTVLKAYKKQEHISPMELRHLELNKFAKKPTLHIQTPSELLFVDDSIGSDVFSDKRKNDLVNFCLNHRHLGFSIILCSQSLKAGVSRRIRESVSHWLLFYYPDISIHKELFTECCGSSIPIAQFERIYAEATRKHRFLMIDHEPVDPAYHFRSGFNVKIKM